MWNAIMLLIRKTILKGQLKKEENKLAKTSIEKKSNKKIKKIKLKIFGINISLTVIIIMSIVSFLLFAWMMYNLLSFMGAVAGNGVLWGKDDEQQQEEEEKNWKFDGNYDIYAPGGEINISGGIYPKDPILKNRAIIMQIFQKSADDAAARSGITLPPEYLFGVMIRETGGYKLFEYADANKDTSWLTNLLYANPACCKGSSCKYMQMGISHFVGGSVVGGKDTGDPATMGINNASGTVPGDHALGFFQWEIPYITNRVNDMTNRGILYPISDLGISESSIQFSRPHFFYLPDQIYMCAQHIVDGSVVPNNAGYKEIYNKVINYEGYKKLNERNKNFIIFCLEQNFYGSGKIFDNAYELYSQLIDLVNDGKIQYLDQLLDDLSSEFYNTSTHKPANARSGQPWVNWLKNKWGITANVSGQSVAVYGVYSACAGKIAWEAMKAEVDAAEKEQMVTTGAVGQWIDYVGSGKFKPTNASGKNYYHQGIQATVFHQTTAAGTTDYREDSWRTTTIGGSSLGRAGCGVYSTAFAITNLTGTLVTPVDIKDYFNEHGIPAWMDNIMDAARAYGLDAYQVDKEAKTSSAQVFEDWVISELKTGAQIINVWGDNSGQFAWYQGGGHYMTIRGYNATNNKLRVFTSAGVNGKGAFDTICQVELPASEVIKYLSSSKGYVGGNYAFVVIKPKGGVQSQPQTSTGAGTEQFVWPLPSGCYTVTSAFGKRTPPAKRASNFHRGIDIGVSAGTDVYAIADGVVVAAVGGSTGSSSNGGRGNYIKIKCNDQLYYLVQHLGNDKGDSGIKVSKGDSVKQGQLIAKSGQSGVGNGPHLHIEIYVGGDNYKNNTIDLLAYAQNSYRKLPLIWRQNGKSSDLWKTFDAGGLKNG